METWSWTDIGYPKEVEVIEICHTISHGYGGGYAASRPGSQKMQKLFPLVWVGKPAANWLNLVEFWRSVYGSADAFYFEFPTALYNVPGYGGEVIGDPANGFDSDLIVGYGDPAIFTCKFLEDRLPQKTHADFPGLWNYSAQILEIA